MCKWQPSLHLQRYKMYFIAIHTLPVYKESAPLQLIVVQVFHTNKELLLQYAETQQVSINKVYGTLYMAHEMFLTGPNNKVKENIFNVVTDACSIRRRAIHNTLVRRQVGQFASLKLYCSRWTTENRKQAIKIVPSIRRPGTNSDQNYVSKLDIPGQCWRNN